MVIPVIFVLEFCITRLSCTYRRRTWERVPEAQLLLVRNWVVTVNFVSGVDLLSWTVLVEVAVVLVTNAVVSFIFAAAEGAGNKCTGQ